MENAKYKKISLSGIVLMTLSSIFGFSNVAIAYDQMSYASIIWYVLAAITFFIPTALMFAEYGSAIKNDHGGVYTWLEKSIGEKWAFIGTFMWIGNWVINLVINAPSTWVTFSTMIFGKDNTAQWSLFGLNSNETIGILGALFTIFFTFIATEGLNNIRRIADIGGILSGLVFIVFIISSIVTLIANHGQLAQPINGIGSFISSPNTQFRNPIAIMSFMVYAIFAYGGIETIGGIIDKSKNPQKTFSKGIIISAAIMTFGYVVSILLCGINTNWAGILGQKNVTLANAMFVILGNAGTTLGHSLGLSAGISNTIGLIFARFTGLATFLSAISLTVVLAYSPIKGFIMGSSKDLWPKKFTTLNKHGMPSFVMWIQVAIVVIILLLISFSGGNAQNFYQILTDMNNESTVFPYLFLVAAFPFFKKLKNMNRELVFFKSKKSTDITVIIVMIVLSLSAIFNVFQPLIMKDYQTTFWTIIGPVIFAVLGSILYKRAMAYRTANTGNINKQK